jgi:serine/threonine protein kinase
MTVFVGTQRAASLRQNMAFPYHMRCTPSVKRRNQLVTRIGHNNNHMERYSVVRELGVGASARVSLALDTVSKRLVALKQLHSNIAFAGGARMKREFRALSSLKHPNIVEVLDYGENAGSPYLTLEYVEGLTLQEWIETRPSLEAVRDVFAQLCDALEVVHAMGMLHRDLKPENVMLNKQNKVKLMDFGLSKANDNSVLLTREGAMVGTVLYMSPEQCRGLELDPRSDLYALGIMLYQAVSGRVPFESHSIAEVLLSHLQVQPRSIRELRADTPTDLTQLIMGLLSKSPNERPISASEVAATLRGVQSKHTVPPPQLLSAPMIGRALELSQVRKALEPAHSVVALIGEAGIGKSRLVQELATHFQDTWLKVHWLENDTPGAWFERFIELLTEKQPEAFWGLSDIAREGMKSGGSWNNDLQRFARYEALRELLEDTDGMIIFEDLHFAHAEDLRHLAHGLRGANKVRAILTYRPEDLAYGFERHLPVHDQSIALTALPPEALERLIEARLGAPIEARLRDVLLERSGGNPWLLEERLRTMLERRQLLERDGIFEWTRIDDQIPENIVGILEKRLEQLTGSAFEFAQAAAVLGTRFDYEDARKILGWDDDRSISALEDMMRARVLLEIAGTRGNGYQFTHPEYAAKLRSDLSADAAKQLHAKAAERLVLRASDVELAEHNAIAQHYQKALELGVRGGEHALKNLHYALAERGFRAALEVAMHLTTSESSQLRARATLGLAEALRATGHIAEAERHYREVSYHANTTLEARARLRLAELLTARGEPIRALEVLSRASGAEVLLARARVALAMSDITTARHHALSAWANLKGHDLELEVDALLLLGQIALTLGQYNRTLLLTKATQSRISRETDLLRYLQLRRLEANAYSGKRQWSKALEVHAEISEEAARVGHLELQVFSLNNTGVILTLEDDVEEALERFKRALVLAKRADDRDLENIAAENSVLCHTMLGQLEQALSLAMRFDAPAMMIWRVRLAHLLGKPKQSLPPLEMIPAWHHGLYALAEIEDLLMQRQYATVLRACQAPREDYLWFWTLYELTARLGLGMDYKETLMRLARPIGDCGIKRSIGREHAVLLRDALEKKLSLEQLLKAHSSLIAIALKSI